MIKDDVVLPLPLLLLLFHCQQRFAKTTARFYCYSPLGLLRKLSYIMIN